VPPNELVEPKASKIGAGVPSLHGVSYSPNGKYMVVAEAAQDAVFTYAVDERGRPTSDEPVSHVMSKSQLAVKGWFFSTVKAVVGIGFRVRRAVVHPNGKHLYLLHEALNIVSVYSVDEKGVIDPKCLQELPVTMSTPRLWIGAAFTIQGELAATEDGLVLSVRGERLGPFGYAESGIRCMNYLEDGAKLELGQLLGKPAAVRHFCLQGDAVLWAGLQSLTKSAPYVRKYVKQEDGAYRMTGEANVGMDVMCVVVEK